MLIVSNTVIVDPSIFAFSYSFCIADKTSLHTSQPQSTGSSRDVTKIHAMDATRPTRAAISRGLLNLKKINFSGHEGLRATSDSIAPCLARSRSDHSICASGTSGVGAHNRRKGKLSIENTRRGYLNSNTHVQALRSDASRLIKGLQATSCKSALTCIPIHAKTRFSSRLGVSSICALLGLGPSASVAHRRWRHEEKVREARGRAQP